MAKYLAASVWLAVLQGSADRALLAVGDSRALASGNGAKFLATVGGCLLGFALAGLPGFMAGLALGGLAGYAVVQIALARHRVSTVQQDIRYTMVLLLGGLVAALPNMVWASPDGAPTWQYLTISGMVLLTVAVWGLLRIRSLGMQR
jgi:hypothetical protein